MFVYWLFDLDDRSYEDHGRDRTAALDKAQIDRAVGRRVVVGRSSVDAATTLWTLDNHSPPIWSVGPPPRSLRGVK